MELTRKAQEIVADYDAYLGANPKDTNALILYGKFLRRVGQEQHAVGYFLEADSINPKLAVVKQQLANYLIEEGRPIDAFPFLIMTIELAPEQADYHYHLGNFLFLFEDDLAVKGFGKDSARAFMHKSFKQAAKLSPSNFDYQLRFAQSFFDHPGSRKNPPWCVERFGPQVPRQIEGRKRLFQSLQGSRSLGTQPAIRCLAPTPIRFLKGTRFGKAVPPSSSQTQAAKGDKKGTETKQIEINHRFFIPDDPHLKRLRLLTERIRRKKCFPS